MAGSTPSTVVLLADDEATIRLVMHDALLEAGYKVVEVSDGRAALQECDRLGDGVSALVTDIRMGPGPDGWAVARYAREINPAVAVIYMSGDSGADWHAQGVPHSAMLQKPFTGSQVVVAIATQLNKTDV